MSTSDDLSVDLGGGTSGAQRSSDPFAYSQPEFELIQQALPATRYGLRAELERAANDFLLAPTVADYKKRSIDLIRRLRQVDRAAAETYNLLEQSGRHAAKSRRALDGVMQSVEHELDARDQHLVPNKAAPDSDKYLTLLGRIGHEDLGLPIKFSRRTLSRGQQPYSSMVQFLTAAAGPPFALKGRRMTLDVAANRVVQLRALYIEIDECRAVAEEMFRPRRTLAFLFTM